MAYLADGPSTATSRARRAWGTWGLVVAGTTGLVALVVALLAVVGSQGWYVAGSTLLLLAASGVLIWRGYRLAAKYVVASLIFALVAFTIFSIGSVSLTLLLLPLFIVAVGILLSARAALVFGGLSVLAYVGIAYLQTRRALQFADQIPMETFFARALVGTLALLATTLLVGAGVRRWEAAIRSNARRVERLLAAVEVGLRATSSYDVDDMLNRMVILICQQFGYWHAQMFLIDGQGEHAELRAATGDAGQKAVARGQSVPVGSMGVIGQVTAGSGPIVALDSDDDPLRVINELLPEARSELALPMRVGERIIGALDVQSGLPDAFTPEDIDVLQRVADQVARAVENTRMLISEAGLLGEDGPARLAARELALTDDPDEFLAILRRHVAGQFDRLSLVRLDGDAQPVTLAVWDRSDLAPYGVSFHALGVSPDQDAPRIVQSAEHLGQEDAALKGVLDGLKASSFAAFPLADPKSVEGVSGYLLLYRRDAHTFSEEEISTFQSLGSQMAAFLARTRMVEALNRQGERLAILKELSRAVSGILDPEAIEHELAQSLGRLLGSAHLSLARLEKGGETASLHVLSAEGEEYVGSRVFPLAQTAVGAVVESGETLITRDLSTSPYKDHQSWRTEDVYGAIVTPLVARGKVLGTLNLGFATGKTPRLEDVDLLEQLATQLAVALDNAQLLEAERRRQEEAAALFEITEVVSSTHELRELLKQVSIRTAQICEVDRCTIFLLDEGSEVLRPLMSQFADGHVDQEQWGRIRSLGGFELETAPMFLQAVRDRQPLMVDDVAGADALTRQWVEPYNIKRFLLVPLVRRDETVGVMVLDYSRPGRRFYQEQITLAMTIGGQVAASLENARLFERLQASLSEATALYNASLAINSSLDSVGMLETSAVEMAKVSGADRLRIYLVGPDPHQELEYVDEVIHWWRDGEKSGNYQSGGRFDPADVPPLSDYPMARSNVILNNLADNDQLPQPTRRALRLKGVESLAMVPLVAGATWLGAVVLEKFDARGFGDDSIRLCRSLADQTALALNAQHLLETSRRTAAREVVLREISSRLRQAPDVESVLQIAVEELGKALGAGAGAARLGDGVGAAEESGGPVRKVTEGK